MRGKPPKNGERYSVNLRRAPRCNLLIRREDVAHWRRPKEKPDTLPMVGVSVLRRSMALRHSAANCSGLLATFDLFNDDGADDKGDGDASR